MSYPTVEQVAGWNAQELFNHVAIHLLKQNEKSQVMVNRDGQPPRAECAYRGDVGRSCAVGCIVPEEVYSCALEGQNVYGLVAMYRNGHKQMYEAIKPRMELLLSLQKVHDLSSPEYWREQLEYVASTFKLEMGTIEKAIAANKTVEMPS